MSRDDLKASVGCAVHTNAEFDANKMACTAHPTGDRTPGRDPMRVAVLRGGVGREREVSLESGRCVAEALRQGGVDVVTSDIRPDDMQILDRKDIDVFFLALHGEFGEDGQLQQVFEDRGLVYTGCGPEASRLAFDKMASKRLFAAAGVAVPAVVEFAPGDDPAGLDGQLKKLGERFVVKPIRQGSSVGVHVVKSRSRRGRGRLQGSRRIRRLHGRVVHDGAGGHGRRSRPPAAAHHRDSQQDRFLRLPRQIRR